MSHRISFDYGTRSTLALCSCGWRELCTTRVIASAAAVDHVDRAHRSDNAGRAGANIRQRHARIAANAASKRPQS